MPDEVCKFCGAPPKHIWHGQVISFTCGTLENAQMPSTMECWMGFVMKLQERIAALEEAHRGARHLAAGS